MCYSRSLGLTVAFVATAAVAEDTALSGHLEMSSTSRVKTSAVGVAYDREFRPRLDVTITLAANQTAIVEVGLQGQRCRMTGVYESPAVIRLDAGSQCPQVLELDHGVRAELEPVLSAGTIVRNGSVTTLRTEWDARGKLKRGFLTLPVTGTISTVATSS
ncbi:MAG: hypothetical protein RL033_4600 [Pseudomonadota bacterium]|jgi:hypothetical protein